MDSATPSDPRRIDAVHERLFGRSKRLVPERYTLHEELGRGAFGRVFRATDTHLKRPVAIKVIPYSSDHELARLDREAHGLARLSHPNIVQVFDKGVADIGRYYISMEYVEGLRLDTWIEHEKPTLRQVIEVFAQAADGLHHAHQRKLVHRDFKPSNVVVDPSGRVRILDFGLAKPSADNSSELHLVSSTTSKSSSTPDRNRDSEHDPIGSSEKNDETSASNRHARDPQTETGTFLGTPRYCAPEQLLGATVTPQSDQFSLCISLFEAIHGSRPFCGRTRMALVTSIETGPIRPRDSRYRAPHWLRRLLDQGLSRDPAKRLKDLGELARVLRQRLEAQTRTHIRFAILGAAATTALFIALIIMTRPPKIELQWDGAWPSSFGPEEVTRLHGTSLLDALENYGERWRAAADDYRQRPDRATGSPAVRCLETGKAQFHQFLTQIQSTPSAPLDGRPSTSTERLWLEQFFDPSDCLTPEPSWETDESLVRLLVDAQAASLRGDYSEARRGFEQARTITPHDLSLQSGLIDYHLGTIQLNQWDPESWNTLADAERSNEANISFAADVVTRRIEAGVFLGVASADELERLGSKLERYSSGTNEGSIFLARAVALFNEGKHGEAKENYTRAREAFESLAQGERHTFIIAFCRLHEAFMESWQDAPRVDTEALSSALSQTKRILGPSHPRVLRYSIRTARVLENIDSIPEAKALLRQALDDQDTASQSHAPAQHFDVLRAKMELIHLDMLTTDTGTDDYPDRTKRWAEDAAAIQKEAFNDGLPPAAEDDTIRLLALLTQAYGANGDVTEMLSALDQMNRYACHDTSARDDVCDYAKQLESQTDDLPGSDRARLLHLLYSCGGERQ